MGFSPHVMELANGWTQGRIRTGPHAQAWGLHPACCNPAHLEPVKRGENENEKRGRRGPFTNWAAVEAPAVLAFAQKHGLPLPAPTLRVVKTPTIKRLNAAASQCGRGFQVICGSPKRTRKEELRPPGPD